MRAAAIHADELLTVPNNGNGKGGAPCKYSEELVQTIISAVEDGCPITHAARISKISFQSLCNYRKQFPDFDEKIKAAISRGIQSRLGIVRKAMESKDENVSLRAATWWLTHIPGAAEHFSESRRLEITGPNGEPPIQIVAVAIDSAKI